MIQKIENEIIDDSPKSELPLKVATVTEYVDLNSGKSLRILQPVDLEDGAEVEGIPLKTEDRVMLGTVVVMTQQGQSQASFPFPEGLSLRDAFENFEAHAKKALEEHQKEEQNKILMPGKDF